MGMLDCIIEGFLNDAKQEDLGPRKQDLFVAADRKMGLDAGLGFVGLEIVC